MPFNREFPDRRKVILVLVDALREDFVDMRCKNKECGVADEMTFLDTRKSRYKNKKI